MRRRCETSTVHGQGVKEEPHKLARTTIPPPLSSSDLPCPRASRTTYLQLETTVFFLNEAPQIFLMFTRSLNLSETVSRGSG